MKKVPFFKLLLFLSFGGAVFICTRLYYINSYVSKGSVTIIPSEYWHEDAQDSTNIKPTVVFNDPTLESKFVGSPTSNSQTTDGTLDTKNHNREKNDTHDSWVQAGPPYVVPQMSKAERSIKIKRLLPPESGAGYGTK